MSSSAVPYPYHNAQMAMHWLVVTLVAVQYLTGPAMQMTFDKGLYSYDTNGGTAIVHALIGSSILIAMIARLVLRRRHAVPPPPDTEPEMIQKISRGTHYAFYVILIGMPLAGMLAVLTGSQLIAAVHGWTSLLLLLLIAAHFAGAMWHLFKRDGVVNRMVSERD
ncbi:cytochrome b [Profundibacterium mesophilum]|uniref:Cytochrome n=1 Tax=Profundibacterium mesophilum KAUST100406-0324 TaxID=1037889 RepID=A0A921TE12_9RHOB|nr:cytochrome b/b6 domain-containing protein [Profundibacterium mesophilum]KAF0676891.1 cytochrome [Profundibacterium mesophilum KAUST100406-0324]